MSLMAPGLEVSLEGVVIQAYPLEFRLHTASGLKESFPLTETSVLGQGHVEADGAAMACDLDGVG